MLRFFVAVFSYLRTTFKPIFNLLNNRYEVQKFQNGELCGLWPWKL